MHIKQNSKITGKKSSQKVDSNKQHVASQIPCPKNDESKLIKSANKQILAMELEPYAGNSCEEEKEIKICNGPLSSLQQLRFGSP